MMGRPLYTEFDDFGYGMLILQWREYAVMWQAVTGSKSPDPFPPITGVSQAQ